MVATEPVAQGWGAAIRRGAGLPDRCIAQVIGNCTFRSAAENTA